MEMLNNYLLSRQPMINNLKCRNKLCGFTLIEVLVGTALLVIIFSGLFAAYRLGLRVVQTSKNKIAAVSIANAQIEKIRNLSYESVGTIGAALPLARGILEETAVQTIDGAAFTIATQVKFVSDASDGVGAEDSCNLDYKKANVTVSWTGNYEGSVEFSTNIAPETKAQELQSCLDYPSGVLSVTVFNDGGVIVPSPDISVYDVQTGGLAANAVPTSGKYSFPLAPGAYRVQVSKTGYSSTRTYGTDEIAVPDNLNPTVLEGREVSSDLLIDKACAIAVDGLSPDGQNSFADSFENESQISMMSNAQVISGAVSLAGPPYTFEGYVLSSVISSDDLAAWDELMFDNTVPEGTGVYYQVLYYDGVNWILIPDSVLGGNSAGFSLSPVNLSQVAAADYPQIKIKANLSTNDPEATPLVNNWQVLWITGSGIATPQVPFHLQGTKTIGEDENGQKVYKHSQDYVLDDSGHLDIASIDSDAYVFSVDDSGGLSLLGTDPILPIAVSAGGAAQINLFLRSQNAFLAAVQDDTTLAPVFSAAVTLINSGSGYEKTQYTDQNGQTYFIFLESGTYDILVNAAGFAEYSGSIFVLQETTQIINIHQNE